MVHVQLEMMTNTGNAEKKNKCRHDDALDDLEGRLDALCSDVEGLKKLEDKVDLVNAFQSDQMSKATDMEKGLSKVQVDVASLKVAAAHCRVLTEMKAVNDRIAALEKEYQLITRVSESALERANKVDELHTYLNAQFNEVAERLDALETEGEKEKEEEKGVEAAPTPNPKECAHCEHKAKKLRGMHTPAGCSTGGQTKRGMLRTMETRLDNAWKTIHELECKTAATTHIATDGWLERDKRMEAMQERIKQLEKSLTLAQLLSPSSALVSRVEGLEDVLKNHDVKGTNRQISEYAHNACEALDESRLAVERTRTLEVTMEGQKRRLVALEDAWKGAEKEVDKMHTFTFPEKNKGQETFEDTARRIGLDPSKREEWTTRDYRLMYNACPKDERTGKPIVNMEQTPTYKTIAKAFSDVIEHRKSTATKPPTPSTAPSTTPSNTPAWLERFV